MNHVARSFHVLAAVVTLASWFGGAPAAADLAPSNRPAPPATTCASDPLRSTGTRYYVCDCQAGAAAGCVAGDDASAGTSRQAPKRTLAAALASFQRMHAGDTVAFCKGGRWNAQPTPGAWTNPRCKATSTCDVRAYDPPWGGTGARPYIEMASGQSFYGNGGPGGARFQGLELHGTGGTGYAFFFYAAANDVLLCDLVLEGFGIGVQVEELNYDGAGPVGARSGISLVASTVRGNATHGWLGIASYGAILYSTFAENGRGLLDHDVYLAGHVIETPGMVVKGNSFRRSGGYGGRPCSSTELVAHANARGLLIEGNTFDEIPGEAQPTCWGIELDDDGAPTSVDAFAGPIVRGNVLRHVGNQAITVSSARDFVVENNLVVAGKQTEALMFGERPSSNTPPFHIANGRVRNNTVYVVARSSKGIVFASAGDGGHEIYNNALYVQGAESACEVARGAAYDGHNLCTTRPDRTWFLDPPVDFTPRPGSPLVNAGTRRDGAAPTADLAGKLRSAPDVGALAR